MKNVMKNRYRIQRTDYLFLIIAMTILNQMKCFVCSLRMVGLAGNAMEGVIDNASMEEDISWWSLFRQISEPGELTMVSLSAKIDWNASQWNRGFKRIEQDETN